MPPSFQKILVIRNDRMGDLLMSLPAIRALRGSYPSSKITLLAQSHLIPLLEGHPDVEAFLPWATQEGEGWRSVFQWAKRLRKEGFDCAVVMNPTRVFHVATFLAGIPIRVGYRRKWGFLLSHARADTKALRDLHEVEYNLELVELLGVPKGQPQLSLPRRPDLETQARKLFLEHGWSDGVAPVAVHPWTSNLEKSWPLDSFQVLTKRLSGLGYPLLVIGESDPMGKGCGGLPDFPGAVNLVGKIPLRLLPAVLRRCRLLISNDSGPVHVAAAVGTPTLVMAPATHAPRMERWRPLGDQHRVLLAPTPEEALRVIVERLACAY